MGQVLLELGDPGSHRRPQCETIPRQQTPTGLNTTRRSLVPTTAPSIPSISSASDLYGGWSGFIGKWVVFCVVGVYQVV